MPHLLQRLKSALADRYAVEREIGRGGMATVFLAEDLKHHRKVAIKVLHTELAAAVGTDRFLREIEIVAGLNHPHILPLHDSGEAEGLLYYVMPYVQGESLRQRLEREKQLPVGDSLRIAREVASALEYAHAGGVVHRDIKPANILLSAGEAVVADFGIARAVEQAGGERVTRTGMTVGTPAYMSPEQGAGEEADERSDIYALGCVLYEMLAGEPPLAGATPRATQARRLTEMLPPLHPVRPSVSEPVDRVIRKALDPIPADRYASAVEFAAALDAAAASVPEDEEPPVTRRGGRVWILAAVAVLAVAALWQLAPRVLAPRAGGGEREVATAEHLPSVAVLPLANRSGRDEDVYFTDGIHDEILTRLYKIGALKVISRTSVMEYRDSPKNLRTIGEEIGARYIVEGGVLRAGGQVRINLQLIDAREDEHLWAETYDRELTVENLLAIQSEIAGQVASSVKAEISPVELAVIEKPPTADLQAYEFYLRGRNFQAQCCDREQLEATAEMFERAIQLDSTFALAYAGLSMAHEHIYWHYDRSDSRMEMARQLAQRAVELEPGLPEAHWALAEYYYHSFLDWDRALEELAIASASQPNNSDLLLIMGVVRRRKGDFRSAIDDMARAAELDSRSRGKATEVAFTYRLLRDYAAAEPYYLRAIALEPDYASSYADLAGLYLVWTGRAERARKVLDEAPLAVRSAENQATALVRFDIELIERNYAAALEQLGAVPTHVQSPSFSYPRALLAAQASALLDRPEMAQAYYDSARVSLESWLAEHPEDDRLHLALGIALAGLGRETEAVGEGKKSVELSPVSKDAWEGQYGIRGLARIYMMIGDYGSALDKLEVLLSRPGIMSAAWLRVHPTWDQLRDQPRFQELLEDEE